MQNPRTIRESRHKSQLSIAAEAGVSLPTLRLYEASNGAGVTDPRKREALRRAYERLAALDEPAPSERGAA